MKKNIQILVIEDDEFVRENIAEILELDDYQVTVAVNGKEGVKKAKEVSPDLILCDVMMPELDGYGVLNILRKQDATATTPFIFLTAKTEWKDLRKGMGLGADDYLTKPFDDVELMDAVETRLKKHNNTKELTTIPEPRKIDFDLIIQESNYNRFAEGNYVFRSGDRPIYLFYVSEGRIKLTNMNDQGKELITDIIEEGDLFGYESILDDSNYLLSAIAIKESVIHKIDKNLFKDFLEKDSKGAMNLLKKMSSKSKHEKDKVMDFAYESAKKRILLVLEERFNINANETVYLSRTDIAQLAGTTTETIARTLSELKKANVIQLDTNEIQLLNREELNKFKHWY